MTNSILELTNVLYRKSHDEVLKPGKITYSILVQQIIETGCSFSNGVIYLEVIFISDRSHLALSRGVGRSLFFVMVNGAIMYDSDLLCFYQSL